MAILFINKMARSRPLCSPVRPTAHSLFSSKYDS